MNSSSSSAYKSFKFLLKFWHIFYSFSIVYTYYIIYLLLWVFKVVMPGYLVGSSDCLIFILFFFKNKKITKTKRKKEKEKNKEDKIDDLTNKMRGLMKDTKYVKQAQTAYQQEFKD